MDIKELVPKHKSDFDRINDLKKLSLDQIRPILPDLLEWLQDINWPIAIEVEEILIGFQEELVPHLKNIFNVVDGQWKYFLLYGLIKRLPDEVLVELKEDLERMLYYPTRDEIDEELDDILKKLLQRIM
ncbi:DUF5071 domain-containing protein [Cohnella fermenti]|uniref:DUF5071 domain-containing protein n=1 Tax=Cohnella fermenti TaxID=2565925 RepID=A0A4S4BTR3_9BACL|nr:DUF5071 domain-containing protein [Cohnella fermenti]THF78463.1 DUF5071 domain-containing protein [Cohnella fermenti]